MKYFHIVGYFIKSYTIKKKKLLRNQTNADEIDQLIAVPCKGSVEEGQAITTGLIQSYKFNLFISVS
jgi:hypothetical protein